MRLIVSSGGVSLSAWPPTYATPRNNVFNEGTLSPRISYSILEGEGKGEGIK